MPISALNVMAIRDQHANVSKQTALLVGVDAGRLLERPSSHRTLSLILSSKANAMKM